MVFNGVKVMTATTLKRFKLKQQNKNDFWINIGIGDATTGRGEAVHKGFKSTVYKNLIARAGLSQNEFQTVTHIPTSTIKRRIQKQERFSSQESDVMYRLASLIKLATELFDDEDTALRWMKDTVYGLGGKRPLDMISTTIDFDTVKDLIGRIEHGVFS